MTNEGREAIQKSNRTRNMRCGKCGAIGTEVVDGEKIGGLPGLQYRYCPGCGWSRAMTKRMNRREMRRGLEAR
jgi:Pyruvate/2-oxoacid:ferredoxin oxidoreductase delta subunit